MTMAIQICQLTPFYGSIGMAIAMRLRKVGVLSSLFRAVVTEEFTISSTLTPLVTKDDDEYDSSYWAPGMRGASHSR